jgi:hypothetical protein
MSSKLSNVIKCLKIAGCVLGGVGAILAMVSVPVAAPIAITVLGIVCGAIQTILEELTADDDQESSSLPLNITKTDTYSAKDKKAGGDNSDNQYDQGVSSINSVTVPLMNDVREALASGAPGQLNVCEPLDTMSLAGSLNAPDVE